MPPSALLLSPEVPFPTIGGGALRTASLFEFLVRNFTLDVITFRQPDQPCPRTLFPLHRMRSLHVIELPFHRRSPFPRLTRNLKRAILNCPPLLDRFSGFEEQVAAAIAGESYRIGVIEHFWCAPYLAQLRRVCRRLVLDLHNIESEWHRSLANPAHALESILHQRFARAYESRERRLLPKFDVVLAASENDVGRVKRLAPDAGCAVFPNTIPWIPVPEKRERDEIIFTGNLEYQPNVSAVAWFKDRVWPELHASWPELKWVIAGKNSGAICKLLTGQPGIEICNRLPDAVNRIAQSKLAVVPLLAGSGTRLKILEAWAAATPVVSTTVGAEGLAATNGKHLLIADRESDFSQAVSSLLKSPSERARIGADGRQLYETSYTYETSFQCLHRVIGV